MSGKYTINEIKGICIPIAKKYGVDKMSLIGSYARNEQQIDSDIDFVIEKGKIQGLEFFGFINNLEDELGVHVDLITYRSLKDSFIENVLNDEVVLYSLLST